jgi:hypothetical protein
LLKKGRIMQTTDRGASPAVLGLSAGRAAFIGPFMATRFNPPIGSCVFIVTRAVHRPLRAVLTWFIVSLAVAGEEGEMEDDVVDTTVQGRLRTSAEREGL